MKRILTFIGLKIAEISALVFIPLLVGKFIHHAAYNYVNWFGDWIRYLRLQSEPAWLDGLGFLVIHLLLPALIAILIGIFMWGNWEWANKLTTKKEA